MQMAFALPSLNKVKGLCVRGVMRHHFFLSRGKTPVSKKQSSPGLWFGAFTFARLTAV